MSAFDNMPDVGKKKVKVQQPPPKKRMPVLLAALAGLVLLLLCLMLAGIGAWYFTLGPGASPQKVGVAVPPGSAPTTPGASSAANTQGVKIAYSVYTGDSPEGHSIWIMNADGSDAKQVIHIASSPPTENRSPTITTPTVSTSRMRMERVRTRFLARRMPSTSRGRMMANGSRLHLNRTPTKTMGTSISMQSGSMEAGAVRSLSADRCLPGRRTISRSRSPIAAEVIVES
jgi:hypothetical protein